MIIVMDRLFISSEIEMKNASGVEFTESKWVIDSYYDESSMGRFLIMAIREILH